jgi:hypothetical protein
MTRNIISASLNFIIRALMNEIAISINMIIHSIYKVITSLDAIVPPAEIAIGKGIEISNFRIVLFMKEIMSICWVLGVCWRWGSWGVPELGNFPW